ncbi:Mu transposase C-terminal domain-containing protein [Motilimonas cestriensis]|uniref:Mu transposase C-terminal domain-containing protein n=1 Tax=Motilimonas cestriensis TaxID=2742685 RepID=A0ABS8W9G1_9GAMM|nr:transposase domain-containing protein [Motilimonas cestriensis]MCE2594439.1 Mu transposase C-terminal domain-containing protein [Motilimonas cestriensis]
MQWITAKEVKGLAGMPSTERRTRDALERATCYKPELKRKREGTKAFEYHIDALPMETRAALLLQASQIEVGGTVFTLPKRNEAKELSYCPEALWDKYDNAPDTHKKKAERKFNIACAVADLRAKNIPVEDALLLVAKKFNTSEGTVRRTYYTVDGFERADWITLFVPKYKARKETQEAEFTPAAWEAFKADYFRLEGPNLTTCLERVIQAGANKGWVVPSESSVRRKIEREIPKDQAVLLRKGEHALMMMYPAQTRSVLQLHAMEHINGDGYQHNVFVRWHNGEILRPKTWFWQDVYSRKIVGYYVDVSENKDSIRLSLMSMIERYGIPKIATIDNTRAAANKELTAGIKTRYRFKVKEDDPDGLFKVLGIDVQWTTIKYGKGHGQAKPIERAFGVGGLEEMIDKHPLNAGAYTGPNPMAKPDNYGSKAIAVEDFLKTVEYGVNQFNSKPNRETEVCGGRMSFDEAFNVSYEASTIRKATKEQLRILMLCSEPVRVTNGTFTLKAGGTIANQTNKYISESLIGMRLKHGKVVVRFDPRNLHQSVFCYTTDGRFICEAQCQERSGFNDRVAARDHEKNRTRFTKATKAAALAQQRMTIAEVAAQLPEVEPPKAPETKIVEMYQQAGNTVRKAQIEMDEDEREEAFGNAISAIWEKQAEL